MALKNHVSTMAVSVSMALAIGFYMQNVGVAPEKTLTQLPEPDRIELSEITLTVGPAEPVEHVPEMALSDAMPAPVSELPVQRIAAAQPLEDVGLEVPLLDVPERACDPVMTLAAQPGAMVLVEVDAPCLAEQRVTIHHNGLMFTHLTDDQGQMAVVAPALASSAVFIADFSNGDGAVGHVMVPDMMQYERAVAQWRGDLGLELHAREFGADYGVAGHVWSGALQSSAAEAQLVLLGDRDLPESYRADVYTVPAVAGQAGDIHLSVEAEVTATNCNRDIQAEALQWRPNGQLEVRELSLAVPGCDTVGDFLLLKNLLQDLKIAAR
jgi:hypothetical protein